jgi:hypothetical protein
VLVALGEFVMRLLKKRSPCPGTVFKGLNYYIKSSSGNINQIAAGVDPQMTLWLSDIQV